MAVVALAACGPASEDGAPTGVVFESMQVLADPPGHRFDGLTEIRLEAPDTEGASIFYTLDGSPATDASAVRYTGPIQLRDTTLVNFIAKDTSDVWSEPGTELYVARRAPMQMTDAPRVLRPERDVIFFAWKPGDVAPMRQVVTLQSQGTEPVTIERVGLGLNPHGEMFWQGGAFQLVSGHDPVTLEPGERIDIVVTYMPTETLRSAALLITSDQNFARQQVIVELWGRVSAW